MNVLCLPIGIIKIIKYLYYNRCAIFSVIISALFIVK